MVDIGGLRATKAIDDEGHRLRITAHGEGYASLDEEPPAPGQHLVKERGRLLWPDVELREEVQVFAARAFVDGRVQRRSLQLIPDARGDRVFSRDRWRLRG